MRHFQSLILDRRKTDASMRNSEQGRGVFSNVCPQFSKGKKNKGGREGGDESVVRIPKKEVCEGGWETGHWLVERIAEGKVSERDG